MLEFHNSGCQSQRECLEREDARKVCDLKQLLWGFQELSPLSLLGSLGNALHLSGTLKNTFHHSCAEQHLREFFFGNFIFHTGLDLYG